MVFNPIVTPIPAFKNSYRSKRYLVQERINSSRTAGKHPIGPGRRY